MAAAAAAASGGAGGAGGAHEEDEVGPGPTPEQIESFGPGSLGGSFVNQWLASYLPAADMVALAEHLGLPVADIGASVGVTAAMSPAAAAAAMAPALAPMMADYDANVAGAWLRTLLPALRAAAAPAAATPAAAARGNTVAAGGGAAAAAAAAARDPAAGTGVDGIVVDDAATAAAAAAAGLVVAVAGEGTAASPTGELLGGAGSTAMVECLACFDDCRPSQAVAMGDCGHKVCYLCAIDSIREALSKEGNKVRCPYCPAPPAAAAGGGAGAPGHGPALVRAPSLGPSVGSGYVSQEAVLKVRHYCRRSDVTMPAGKRPLSDEEGERVINKLVAASLGGEGGGGGDAERTFTCPNPRCGKLIIVGAGEAAVEAPCPYCSETLCQSCGVAWAPHHAGRTCAGTRDELRRAATLAEFDAAGAAGTFKPCPGCGAAIFKGRGHGCHHTTCGVCHDQFCIVCMGRWPCPSGCGTFCSDECDCADCDTCTVRRSCPQCASGIGRGGVARPPSTNTCCSCTNETVAQKTARIAMQHAARTRKMATGWCGPRRVRDGPSIAAQLAPGGALAGAGGLRIGPAAAAGGAAGGGGGSSAAPAAAALPVNPFAPRAGAAAPLGPGAVPGPHPLAAPNPFAAAPAGLFGAAAGIVAGLFGGAGGGAPRPPPPPQRWHLAAGRRQLPSLRLPRCHFPPQRPALAALATTWID